MIDVFCRTLFSFILVFFVSRAAFASEAPCYETSSRVSTAALIRNKWIGGSKVCGRFTPTNQIVSKGGCKNRYCPVVLDGSEGCGKRGWIHKSLITETSCNSTNSISSLAPKRSLRPTARPVAVGAAAVLDAPKPPPAPPVIKKPVSSSVKTKTPSPTKTTAPTSTSVQNNCYESTGNYLNVRYKAGLRNRVCGKMMRGDKLASKGECVDGWCPVKIKNCGGRGWISRRFLKAKNCKASEISSDFGLQAGVYWEDEKFSNIAMRPGYMGQNDGGQSCSAKGIRESRCQRLIKMNAHAALGLCLPDGDAGNLEELMQKHNINVYSGRIPVLKGPVRRKSNINLNSNANKNLRRVLSKVLLAFDSIGTSKINGRTVKGGVNQLKKSSGVDIIFDDGTSVGRYSRKHGRQIQLKRGSQNRAGCAGHSTHGGVDNVALIVHELSHYVGSYSGGYDGLWNATGGKFCMVSNYSDGSSKMKLGAKKAEHFAEAFTAYMLMPERFIGKGPACDKAFNYMKKFFGEPDMTKSCIARKRSYKIKGTGAYDENNEPQSSKSIN